MSWQRPFLARLIPPPMIPHLTVPSCVRTDSTSHARRSTRRWNWNDNSTCTSPRMHGAKSGAAMPMAISRKQWPPGWGKSLLMSPRYRVADFAGEEARELDFVGGKATSYRCERADTWVCPYPKHRYLRGGAPVCAPGCVSEVIQGAHRASEKPCLTHLSLSTKKKKRVQ